MIPHNGVGAAARAQAGQEGKIGGGAAGVVDHVAEKEGEVRVEAVDGPDQPDGGSLASPMEAAVEIGGHGDGEPVERGRQAREGDLNLLDDDAQRWAWAAKIRCSLMAAPVVLMTTETVSKPKSTLSAM